MANYKMIYVSLRKFSIKKEDVSRVSTSTFRLFREQMLTPALYICVRQY